MPSDETHHRVMIAVGLLAGLAPTVAPLGGARGCLALCPLRRGAVGPEAAAAFLAEVEAGR